MPNWCTNDVRIDGSEEDIEKFKQECFTEFKGDAVLDFNKVLPEPDYDKPKKDGTHNDGTQVRLSSEMPSWWHWRNDNWGTKWSLVPHPDGDLISYEADMGEDYISLNFHTAWSPPNGIYEAIVERYPDLSINWFYREDGVQIAGWLPYD
jgi:hypothetical protein